MTSHEMRASSKSRGVAKTLLGRALWFCACNALAAALSAQCSNPTSVPNQTISSGAVNYSDNNALSASNVIINGSAGVTFVAGNCIQLLPGFHATAGSAGTTFHAWVETAPAAVSFSPASGSGLTQQFTWTVSSPSGYSNLADVFALFNTTSASTANACYIRYNRLSNLLYLADNASANWSSGFVPGSSNSASNSYCTINGSGSSVSGSGTQLVLTVSVTFQASFAGTKNEYLIGYDNSGLYTGWFQFGTWTVPAPQQYYLTTAVTPSGGGTISPASGWYNSGTTVQISANAASGYVFSGFTGNLSSSTTPQYITVNSPESVTANFAPYTTLSIVTTVMPAANGGAPYAVPLAASGGTPPYSWSLVAGSLPSGLTLNSSTGMIAGNSASAGTSVFTIRATDAASATTTQQLSMTVTLPALSINGGSNSAEVAPSTNVSLAFNLYDQANGANDIAWGQFYLADSSGNADCYGDWGRPNGLDLYDGNTGATYGFGINQSDSFCTVSLASITNSATDPTEVTIVLNVNFNPGPGGTYTVLTQTNYGSGYAGPWEALGTLTIDPGHVTISGHITASGFPIMGALVNLSGSSSAAATTDNSGSFSFMATAGGNYTITPSEGGLAFAPSSLSWNTLRATQTADFTAVPDDFPTGSGPVSIPNSFTAPDPVLTCDDISGVWDDADNIGNHIGWNLTQTGASITGQMAYEAFRSGVDCGMVTYDVTGSYNSGSLSYSLSATIHGTPFDSCGLPVATQETETVTLSGRACGIGSAQYDIRTTSLPRGALPMMTRALSSAYRGAREKPSSLASASPRPAGAQRFADAVALRPLDAQGASGWTTISPRFTVQYSSYIPVNRVGSITFCYVTIPGIGEFIAGGKTYKGDAFQSSYRTTESLLVVPGAQKYGNLFVRGGPTRNYQIPSSPANGSGANLSSNPTGDLWNDSYVGADEDGVPGDCHLWNAKGEADKSGMSGVNVTYGSPITQVNLSGHGSNPLETPQAQIKWGLTISLDTTDPTNPKAWVSGGTTTCYPAHIVKVNGVVVYSWIPSRNDIPYIGGCLIANGSPVSPSLPTVVPAH
jgi:hypothetical protein